MLSESRQSECGGPMSGHNIYSDASDSPDPEAKCNETGCAARDREAGSQVSVVSARNRRGSCG